MPVPGRTCNFPCISSHPNLTADYTDNADLHGSRSRKSVLFRSPDVPITRSPDLVALCAPPPPSRIIPSHPRSSQIGVDLGGFVAQALLPVHSTCRHSPITRSRAITRSPDLLQPSACVPQPATHPPIAPLLKTKAKVQFDWTVTERSKPFFCVFQRSN